MASMKEQIAYKQALREWEEKGADRLSLLEIAQRWAQAEGGEVAEYLCEIAAEIVRRMEKQKRLLSAVMPTPPRRAVLGKVFDPWGDLLKQEAALRRAADGDVEAASDIVFAAHTFESVMEHYRPAPPVSLFPLAPVSPELKGQPQEYGAEIEQEMATAQDSSAEERSAPSPLKQSNTVSAEEPPCIPQDDPTIPATEPSPPSVQEARERRLLQWLTEKGVPKGERHPLQGYRMPDIYSELMDYHEFRSAHAAGSPIDYSTFKDHFWKKQRICKLPTRPPNQ